MDIRSVLVDNELVGDGGGGGSPKFKNNQQQQR